MNCPCSSGQSYEACCGPFIKGEALPDTAEKLMRSRYTAFAKAEIEYLKKTLAPESRTDFDAVATKKWADQAKWKGLQILETKKGTASDNKGTVEFIATYEAEGEALDHHEVAQFRKTDSGQWYFVDGDSHTHKEGEGHQHHHKPQTVQRESPKIGRNDPCVCGSGKKYKKCCGAESAA
ncbi:MAG: YchJ family protein [Pseudobdellovibrio sp.]